MALLEELRPGFAEHDAFLHLMLGLLSLSHRFEQTLSQGSAVSASAAPEGAPAPATEEDRPLMAVLGLVSLRHTLLAALGPAGVDTPAGERAAEPADPGPLPPPRELLR